MIKKILENALPWVYTKFSYFNTLNTLISAKYVIYLTSHWTVTASHCSYSFMQTAVTKCHPLEICHQASGIKSELWNIQ